MSRTDTSTHLLLVNIDGSALLANDDDSGYRLQYTLLTLWAGGERE